MLLIIDAIYAF